VVAKSDQVEERRQAKLDALREEIRKGVESGPGIPAEQIFEVLEHKYRGE
jgi:antitoxin ParD1/3/4